MTDLIITNGDSAADLLREAGRDAVILPWRDILHEGPIVAGRLETCSAARAPFLAARFGIDIAEIAAEFAERDALMRNHGDYDRIELWFEHDLYDQLQLVQLLSFFADAGRQEGLILVQANDFLGTQTPATVLRFADAARTVDEDSLDAADFIWSDLAMPAPDRIAARLEEAVAGLPFLQPALVRFLEELPAPGSGLGRTEATALALLADGVAHPVDLFRAAIAAEEAAFMGDLSFFALLDDLAGCRAPLISGMPDAAERAANPGSLGHATLRLTTGGAAVLAGEADHVAENGLDRWWAGTRLLGTDVWRFDRDQMMLVPPGPGA